MKTLYKILAKEPVLLGAAAIAVFTAAAPNASAAWNAAAVAVVAWIVRTLSTPTSKVAARVEEAKYVGAVEHQALAALAPPARPPRVRAAAKKAAGPARR